MPRKDHEKPTGTGSPEPGSARQEPPLFNEATASTSAPVPGGAKPTVGLLDAFREAHIPTVDCRYGSPLGRPEGRDGTPSGPVTVLKVVLDDGGYDAGGAYWGTPNDLYCAEDGEGFRDFIRAENRQAVQEALRKTFPDVIFSPAMDTQAAVRGYLYSATIVGFEENAEGVSVDDFAPESIQKAEDVCARFMADNARDLKDLDEYRAGVLLWLNRNGHGTGFWDESTIPEEAGARLSEAAHRLGGSDAYLGDDGKIYLT